MKELYERTLLFATLKHAGQVRKDGKPYITHPEKVAGNFDYSEEKVAAILHDVLEDTDATEDELRAIGCTEEIIAALRLLTHREGVEYMDYVKAAAENPIACAVKLADLRHNLGTIDVIRGVPGAERLEARYREAVAYIESLDDNSPE
jgi:(p)ppGpp synthase/HD superfamily hydrolase